MASSTFEVTETESETEKDISFGLEATTENELEISAQIDGEVSKDHNYTKDPDESEEELFEVVDTVETSPEKPAVKSTKGVKRSSLKNTKSPKAATAKKSSSMPKKGKAKKKVLTEDLNTADGNLKEKEPVEPPKKGRKRKVEEKENVIDKSIAEEVKNIKGDAETDADKNSPAKKRKAIAPKSLKSKSPQKTKNATVVESKKDNQSMPKGWVKKEVVRKSGKSAGIVDIYIYSPDGTKMRSKPEVIAYLARINSNLKIEDFNFSKRKASEIKTSSTTSKKEKSLPAVKPKVLSKKKKVQSSVTPSRKLGKLVVNFKPKGKKAKNKANNKLPKKQSKTIVKKAKVTKKKKST